MTPTGTWSHRRRTRRDRLATARDALVPRPRNFAAFGRSTFVAPIRITNPDCIDVGDDVTVLEHTFLSVVRRFPDLTPRLVLEDGVTIGRGCGFAVVGEVVVARGARIGDFCLIADTYHPYEARERLPVVVRPDPVRIGAGAVLGSHAVVLPGVSIGAGAHIEHHAVVGRDVPDGGVVAAHLTTARTAG